MDHTMYWCGKVVLVLCLCAADKPCDGVVVDRPVCGGEKPLFVSRPNCRCGGVAESLAFCVVAGRGGGCKVDVVPAATTDHAHCFLAGE